MFKKTLGIPLLVMCYGLLVMSCFAQEEKLTITTYYPSPYGSYREIRAQRMAIGDNYSSGSQYCWEGTCTNTIDANTDLVVEGNVGIGTASPTQKLTLDLGSTRDGISIISDGNSNAYSDLQSSIKNTSALAGTDIVRWTISHRKDGYFSGLGPAISSLEFYGTDKNGNYRAPLILKQNGDVILASPAGSANLGAGNVGIGTVNPPGYNKLTVNGGWLQVTGAGATSWGDDTTRIGVYDTDNTGGVSGWWFSQNNDGKFAIHQNAVSDRLIIDGSGNVGIGTPDPTSKLSIGTNGAAGWEYLKIDMEDDDPPAGDCNEQPEGGRMIYAHNNQVIWVCDGAGGWKRVGGGPTGGGFIARGTILNLGSDWTVVSLSGQFVASDSGAAGGYIYKIGSSSYAAIFSATVTHAEFQLSSSFQCSGTGSYSLCARLGGDNLYIRTGADIQVSYVKLR